MKNILKALCVSSLMILVSCGGGGGSGGGGGHGDGGGHGGGGGGCSGSCGSVDKVQSFVDLLNNRYVSDSTYYVAKRPEDTATEDFVVVYSPDTGYVAYDIKWYHTGDTWGTYSVMADYQPVYIHSTSYDPYYGETFYFGDAYENDYIGSYAGEFVFDETSETGKDLEKAYALIDAHKASKIASALTTEFGLSEERGLRVAKLVADWKKLSKSRSMTTADADVFSKELLGVDMKTAESALKKHAEGDESEVENLIERSARVNGTSPEHMSDILKAVFTN